MLIKPTTSRSTWSATYDRREREQAPRLILNEQDDGFYRALVIQKAAPTPQTESQERLKNAYELLKRNLSQDVADHGRKGDERLLRWLDFLDDSVLVITVEVPTEADAFVIFETLNDRGAALTIGDLLKNYLFMRSDDRLETVKSSWTTALAALDVSAENETFVTFLRHYWSRCTARRGNVSSTTRSRSASHPTRRPSASRVISRMPRRTMPHSWPRHTRRGGKEASRPRRAPTSTSCSGSSSSRTDRCSSRS